MVHVTDPLFLTVLRDTVAVGEIVTVRGDEAFHAVSVKRISPRETVQLADGEGLSVRCEVLSVAKREFTARVLEVLRAGPPSQLTWRVVQALAKGDRSDFAVQMATELGAHGIIAWQASRSIVRWQADRLERSLERWRSTAREAAKQSRRVFVPTVEFGTTNSVVNAISEADVTLVLHEEAAHHIADTTLPTAGTGLIVVGPEGGISPEELERFTAAGARCVSISDGVLRTSTAAAVALGQLDVLARNA